MTFEVVRPTDSPGLHGVDPRSTDPVEDPELDPGIARAGSAAAARRRELDISQRSLATGGIINAGALIAFEKGRSWPRERTRAKLEEVLEWPPGTILRIRQGDSPGGPVGPVGPVRAGASSIESPSPQRPPNGGPSAESQSGGGEASLIAQAVVAAVDVCSLAIVALPPADDLEFIERSAPILADLRQLETVVVQAMRIGRITSELIGALRAVRHYRDELMVLGATAPGAPLAQRLYAARRRANLSTAEIAQVAGIDEQQILRAESGEPLPAGVAETLDGLISQID